MRLLICAGMTGGGVYPALAVHQALKNRIDATLWVGSKGGLEETLLSPYGIPYKSISGGGMHGLKLGRLLKNTLELIQGYRQAKAIVQEFKPDVIFYTGGYIGVPLALAAYKSSSVVFIPDVEPGLALKVIMRNAKRINISSEDSLKYLPDPAKAVISGYPLRRDILGWDQKSGRKFFGIGKGEKVLLVFGGSKGAKSINDALTEKLPTLLPEMHVIHITGTENWEDVRMQTRKLPRDVQDRYHVYPFLHKEMGAAFSAADLVVCRAGASTIGELPYFGLPAILIPYPHAWKYQVQNAEFLVSHGGAEMLKDENLREKLLDRVMHFISDSEKLHSMREKMRSIANNEAAKTIAETIIEAGLQDSGGNNK